MCRNCNGNIVLKKTSFGFIWEKSSQRRNTAGFRKVLWLQNYVRRLFSRAKIQSLLKSLNFRSLLRWLFIPEFSRIQKRGNSLVDSPASSSSPSSGREKTKSKVSWFRDVYVLNNLRLILKLDDISVFSSKHFHGSYNFFGVPIFVFVYSNCLDLLWASGYLYFTSPLFCYKFLFSVCKCKREINCLIPNTSV